MSELIRYALAESSLGHFVAASSESGLVVFEFGDNEADLLQLLATRLPDAKLQRDQVGLHDVVSKLQYLVDHPERDPAIAIDPRGDADQQRVWKLLRDIPPGQTTSYGALAAKLGTRDARGVTEAIGANPLAILIPCHRVLKKDGSISGYRWGVRRKRTLLKREQQSANYRLE